MSNINLNYLAAAILVVFVSWNSNKILAVLPIERGNNIMASRLLSVDFEVFGTVQGVFFRKFTEATAKKLELKGWCRNTEKGTVQGVVQGETQNVNQMKEWLQKIGSPQSRIERAEFTNEKNITDYTYKDFSIKK